MMSSTLVLSQDITQKSTIAPHRDAAVLGRDVLPPRARRSPQAGFQGPAGWARQGHGDNQGLLRGRSAPGRRDRREARVHRRFPRRGDRFDRRGFPRLRGASPILPTRLRPGQGSQYPGQDRARRAGESERQRGALPRLRRAGPGRHRHHPEGKHTILQPEIRRAVRVARSGGGNKGFRPSTSSPPATGRPSSSDRGCFGPSSSSCPWSWRASRCAPTAPPFP